MSIQRVPPVPFTQIANSALRDKRLSFKARGLLGLVLSNVGEWNCSLAWLVAQSESDGRVAVQAALNELTKFGYRSVSQERTRNGRLQTIVTWRHEPESSVTRPAENPTGGLPDGRETRAPIEEHLSEQHPTEEQEEPKRASNGFDEFWEAYPKKRSKGQAERTWAKAIKETDPRVIVHGAIEFAQWCVRAREDRQFIPYPSSWLNAKGWLDERDERTEPQTNMQAHLALVQQMWENEGTNRPQLEG